MSAVQDLIENAKSHQHQEQHDNKDLEERDPSKTTAPLQTSISKTKLIQLKKEDILKDVSLDMYLLFGLDRSIVSLENLIKEDENYKTTYGIMAPASPASPAAAAEAEAAAEAAEEAAEEERQEDQNRQDLRSDVHDTILYIIYYLSLYKDKLCQCNKDYIDQAEKKKLADVQSLSNDDKSLLNLAFTEDFVPLEAIYDYFDSLCMCKTIALNVQENSNSKVLKETITKDNVLFQDLKDFVAKKSSCKEVITPDGQKDGHFNEEEIGQDSFDHLSDVELHQTLGAVQYHIVRIRMIRAMFKRALDEMINTVNQSDLEKDNGDDVEVESHETLPEDLDMYMCLIDDQNIDTIIIDKSTEKEYMDIVRQAIQDCQNPEKISDDDAAKDQESDSSFDECSTAENSSHDCEEEQEKAEVEDDDDEEQYPLLHKMIRVKEDFFTPAKIDYIITKVLPTFACQQFDDIVSEYSVNNNLKASHVFKSM